jgi:hypothetical protein
LATDEDCTPLSNFFFFDEFRAHLLQTTRSIDNDHFILEQLISSSQSYPSTYALWYRRGFF